MTRLFRKNQPKSCATCEWADETTGEEMLCYRRGPVASVSRCGKYRYDPYKRVPEAGVLPPPLHISAETMRDLGLQPPEKQADGESVSGK